MPDMNWQFDTLLSNEKASNTAWLLAFRWRRRWDSNPRALADNRISSAARYDHFDTSPYNSACLHLERFPQAQAKLYHKFCPSSSKISYYRNYYPALFFS